VGLISTIWSRPQRSTRGPRPAHSQEEVTAAAIELADAEGIEALTMRKVAARLGAGTTSLYRCVANRDDILDLMADAILRRNEPPPATGDWRADLTALADTTRQTMLRHPWLAGVVAARPSLGPGSLRWMEAWLTPLDGHGLDADEMLVGALTVQTFVTGAVLSETAQRQARFDAEQWMAEQGSRGEAIIAGDKYPRLARIMVEASGPHAKDRIERAYRLGVERILDGLATGLKQ
jgi:AcrR family transcriptional regulator